MSQTQTLEQIQAELARLREENDALKAKTKPKSAGFSVTPKGTVRVPGIGMMGLCLYQEQWNRLFEALEIPMPEKLVNFIAANQDKLSVKPEGHVSIFAEEFKRRAEAKAKAAKKSSK